MLKKIFLISFLIVTQLTNAQIMLPAYQPIQYVNDETICAQNWSQINLNTSTYSDGTPIPEVTDASQWWNLTTGAWCYYNNDPANGSTYGKLYNWYAVAGIYDAASSANPSLRKKLAPTGWHIPSTTEYFDLINCLGGYSIAGGKMREIGTLHWLSPNAGATNTSGFTGLPGGYRSGSTNSGAFWEIGRYGVWWSSSGDLVFGGAFRYRLFLSGVNITVLNDDIRNGYSVRCVKD